MFGLKEVATIENGADSEEEYFVSLQVAINSLSAWSMQGSMGRAMMGAIDSGHCMLAVMPTRDYWGSRIPSRAEVKPGTKGSYEYVAERMGTEWADQMAAAMEAV